ncbi:MAG: hypothetical protein N3D85_05155 [Candidatus Bathyarchaeota archaeon]|nr:hypothetical protein [Candidatus Bathyarchaeota archaeon]
MQSNRKPSRHSTDSTESATKRTTIILEKDERQYVDQLISEGKEPGIKHLISKMLTIYKNMMIEDWRFPGEYYFGISRVAFVNVELITLLIKQVPKEKRRILGKTMGVAMKVSMETTLDVSTITSDNWSKVFKRLSVQGWGDFSLKDKYLIVKTPFISEPEVLAGLMETLLGVTLEVKTVVPPLVFEVKRSATPVTAEV